MIRRLCERCQANFSTKPYLVTRGWGRFCSPLCRGQHMRTLIGDRAGGWKGGKAHRNCLICQKVFFVHKSDVARGLGNYCSKPCRAVRMSEVGKTRPTNLIHGMSKTKLYKRVREHIRQQRKCHQRSVVMSQVVSPVAWEELKRRYRYRCPACGAKEPETKLTVDHIIPLIRWGAHDIKNLQPLCRPCNSKKSRRIVSYLPGGGGFELTDMRLLAQAIVRGEAPLECVTPNQIFLDYEANRLKKNLRYPGIKPICEKSVAGRR